MLPSEEGEPAMHQQIDVVYGNGVLRPLGPLPCPLEEHQHLTVTLEGPNGERDWLADADPSVGLEEVRQALAHIPGTLARLVDEEREER
jgi:predicted DNA-binding antitoxin AbrB/MazE fold protein